MIPVHGTNVVVNEERETYRGLLESELHLEGSASVGMGPVCTLNISAKLDDQENDSRNLVGELLDDTEAEIRKIRLYRGERGCYRAKVIENLDDDRTQNIYEKELSDALVLATETGAQLQRPPELLQNNKLSGDDSENNKQDLRTISDLYDELEQSMDPEANIEEKLCSAYDPDAE